MRHLDIRLKLILIIAVSVLVFWAGNLYVSATALSIVLTVWFLSKLGFSDLKPITKIKWFLLAIIFFHGYFSYDRDLHLLTLFKFEFWISKEGLLQGVMMGCNVLTMVAITSLVRKTSKPDDLVKGLRQLGLSADQAIVLDATLEMVEVKQGEKKGKGSGGGKKGNGGAKRSIWGMIKGKVNFLVEMVNEKLSETNKKFKSSNVAIMVTFTGIITAIRFIKVAPGLPVAPGHKSVLIMPLFINAVKLSSAPFTATNLGFLSGIINFQAGYGQKYGPLGILQFMVPGLVIDLLKPIFKHSNSILIFGFVGLLAGASRVAAEITLAYLVGMPQEFYIVYLPLIFSQCAFGMFSAPVTKYLSNNLKNVGDN